ncbi:MAG: hypothetical protein R3B06_10415 [Kofleriaceae bacterium]
MRRTGIALVVTLVVAVAGGCGHRGQAPGEPAPSPGPTPTPPAPAPDLVQAPPAVDPAVLGSPCGADGACPTGTTCVTYYGIAGPRGPAFSSCNIRCADQPCPAGLTCVTIADGPGQVCQAPPQPE